MKRKISFILASTLVLCLMVSGVQASSLSLVPTPQTMAPGDSFTLDLVIDFIGDPTLGGSLDFVYDNALVSFVGWSFSSLSDPDFSNAPDAAGIGLAFGDFGGLTDGTVGTATFAILPSAPLNYTTLINTVDPSTDTSLGPFVSTANTIQNPENIGATIQSVPIPGSILLLGSGVLGLVGLSRRKRS
jgi:hypothetical protein